MTVVPLLATPEGHLEYLLTGSGTPTTVFAHGLAGSIAETRPLGSGVHGTRAFFHFRAHGASSTPEGPWTYAALAGDLRAVADHTGAAQAVGASMGAGALLRLLADAPRRFARVVFFLPAAVDQPRRDAALDRLVAMAGLADEQDVDGVAALLLAEQPVGARGRAEVRAWAHRQACTLVGAPVSEALRTIPGEVPLNGLDVLAHVTAPALVIAQHGDDAHPVAVADRLAGALPHARLHVFDQGGALWSARRELRALVAGFLNRR